MMRPLILMFLFLLTCGISRAGDPVKDLIKAAGDPKDYPGDNLLILFDSTRTEVMESGLSYVRTHTLTKILTAKGALDLTVVKTGYDPLSAYAEIQNVVIYKKDGSTRKLNLQNVLDYPAPARAIYWGAREKMIETGRLDPGDAVEVELFRKGFTYALLEEEDDSKYIPPMKGHFYDIVEFWSGNPVKEKVYQVSVPKDKMLQYRIFNGELQSSVLPKGDKMEYTFSRKNIVPIKPEPRMVAASDVAPKLLLSTSPDWFAKSKWFYKVNEDYGSFTVTPEIQAKVNEILAGATDEMDSVSRLTHWVADEIRYSGISMGCGEGYTLHKGGMTFTDRCGVCKDKAGMLITMLRAAGFASFPAMTMAGSRIDNIPADQFNHSVTVVKLKDGKYHLLDPTWVPFVRELWSSAEQQQQYLMGVPEGADLATTPLSPAENHYLRIKGTSRLSEDGTLEGEVTLTAEGQSDASIRSMFRTSPQSQWRILLEKEILKIDPQAQIQGIEFSDPIDYRKGPIRIRISYRIPEYALISGDRAIFTPLAASNVFRIFQPQLSFDTGLKERKYPFRDRCSREVEIQEEIQLPPGLSPVMVPPSRKNDGVASSYECRYDYSAGKLILTENFEYRKRIYDAGDWPEFRDAVSAQNDFAETPVVLKKKK